jgi:hypothetical protein
MLQNVITIIRILLLGDITTTRVWIEIPVNDAFNLLVTNHYLSPKSDNKLIEN